MDVGTAAQIEKKQRFLVNYKFTLSQWSEAAAVPDMITVVFVNWRFPEQVGESCT